MKDMINFYITNSMLSSLIATYSSHSRQTPLNFYFLFFFIFSYTRPTTQSVELCLARRGPESRKWKAFIQPFIEEKGPRFPIENVCILFLERNALSLNFLSIARFALCIVCSFFNLEENRIWIILVEKKLSRFFGV